MIYAAVRTLYPIREVVYKQRRVSRINMSSWEDTTAGADIEEHSVSVVVDSPLTGTTTTITMKSSSDIGKKVNSYVYVRITTKNGAER